MTCLQAAGIGGSDEKRGELRRGLRERADPPTYGRYCAGNQWRLDGSLACLRRQTPDSR